MIKRVPLDGRATGLMVILCAVWGLQQIGMKAAAPDMAPILQVGLRSGVAALMVGVYLKFKGIGILPDRQTWLPGLVAGILFSLEYLFAGEGIKHTNAAHMATMLYTAPAFAALGLHFFIPQERLNAVQWAGIILAFCGVAVAFYEQGPSGEATGASLWGDFLGLLGGLSWGATTVVIRCSKLADIPSTKTVFYQIFVAFCTLVLASALTGQHRFEMTPIVWGSMIYQTILVSFASLLVWFWLLKVYIASQLGVLSFLTPVFGIIFGILLLDEKLEPKFIAGSLLVMAGIVLVSGKQWLTKRHGPSKERTAPENPKS